MTMFLYFDVYLYFNSSRRYISGKEYMADQAPPHTLPLFGMGFGFEIRVVEGHVYT